MPYEPETMTFALAADGRKVHIDEVANGLACDCVCLKCGGKLVGRHGDVRQHHFSHYLATDGFGCTETALHLAAKAIIQQERRLILPQQLAGMGLQLGVEVCFDSVSLEYRLGSGAEGTEIVADAYGHGAIDMVIEIAVHHEVDQNKVEKIRRLGLPAVEITLTNSVSSLWDWETLRHAVVADPLRRRWINLPEPEPVAELPIFISQTPPTWILKFVAAWSLCANCLIRISRSGIRMTRTFVKLWRVPAVDVAGGARNIETGWCSIISGRRFLPCCSQQMR